MEVVVVGGCFELRRMEEKDGTTRSQLSGVYLYTLLAGWMLNAVIDPETLQNVETFNRKLGL